MSKHCFLDDFLEERLYVIQPEGFVNPKGANKMCKLQRSICGLVQASRSWNIRFDKLIKAYSFIQTCGETCISKEVSGSTIEFLESIQGYLKSVFNGKPGLSYLNIEHQDL